MDIKEESVGTSLSSVGASDGKWASVGVVPGGGGGAVTGGERSVYV